MKSFIYTSLLSSLILCAHVNASSLSIGSYMWQTSVSEGKLDAPDFTSQGSNNAIDQTKGYRIDVKADDATNSVIYIDWQHDIAYFPNLKASINNIEHSGEAPFVIEEYSGVINDGKIDLPHYDLIAYWPILDSVVNIDLGVTIRTLDGEIGGHEISFNGSDNVNYPIIIPISTTIPLLYSRAELDLPLGFNTGFEFMWGDNGDEKGLDIINGCFEIWKIGYVMLPVDIDNTISGVIGLNINSVTFSLIDSIIGALTSEIRGV